MRVLFISFYYPPDLCPGSFRAQALTEALLAADGSLEVDVLSTMPNRYASHRPDSMDTERQGRLSIQRIRLPSHGGGFAGQALSSTWFCREAMRIAAQGRYDVVVATSARLLTALLASRIARHLGVPLYLDIRDIFSMGLPELFPRLMRWPLRRLLEGFEAHAVNAASRVNLVSRGFAGHFYRRYPQQRFSFHCNGVDDLFQAPVDTDRSCGSDCLELVYAGNLGAAQSLHGVLPALALRLGGRARFTLYGDGNRAAALKAELVRRGVENVRVLPPVPRERLPSIYAQADVLFLHLDDWHSSTLVLPSKLFEYIASGKPILAGLAGFGASFLAEHARNAAVFAPNDVEGAHVALERLCLETHQDRGFVERYGRATIMNRMVREIISLSEDSGRLPG